jgi:hypothetical protein
MRVYAAPASCAAWCLRGPAGHQTLRPPTRSPRRWRAHHPGAEAGRAAHLQRAGAPMACSPRATSGPGALSTTHAVLARAVPRNVLPSRAPTRRHSARARVPCARLRHSHNARASAGACSAPVRGAIAEHTPAEHPQQRQGPATPVLVGATHGGGGQAPAGPGTPAAVTTCRAPRRAQWWAGSRISSGLSSG